MTAQRLVAAVIFIALSLAKSALAQNGGDLLDLINAYRTASQTCEGKRVTPAGPLAPNAALAQVRLAPSTRLLDAVKARGYQAASAYVITVNGLDDANAVMRYIEQRYCTPLSSPQFTEVGIARNGSQWQIVLARRLLSPNLGNWRHAGTEILRLTNAARAHPRTCGTQRFDAAPSVAWNDKLAAAALHHSRDMASRNYLEHVDPNGRQPGDRVWAQGYAWREVGENIAAGQGSPDLAMTSWLSSPVHCANIMNGRFTEMGAAYAVNPTSDATIYWTHVFALPR